MYVAASLSLPLLSAPVGALSLVAVCRRFVFVFYFSSFFFQLAAKEAYLEAKAELADEDRRRILAEFRTLIQEAATTAAEAATEKVASKAAAAAALEAAESAVMSATAGSGSGGETPKAETPAAASASTAGGGHGSSSGGGGPEAER